MPEAWINGQFVDEQAAAVSIRDTGLLHAAGAFTTMRARNGFVFRLEAHLARLRNTCQALGLGTDYDDQAISAATADLLARNGLADARLRLTATRGFGGWRDASAHARPTLILTAAALEPPPKEFYDRGITVVLEDQQKLNPYELPAGHKALNYLPRMLALRQAAARGAAEALWFNVHNYLQSGSVSNVLLAIGGQLVTPPTQAEMDQDPALAAAIPYARSNVLPGITRAALLEIAREQGLSVRLAAVNVNELLEAHEVMVCNSALGVLPVSQIEKHRVGQGEPGPIATMLGRALAEMVDRECPPAASA